MTWFLEWFATINLMKIIGLGGQVIFGSRFFVQWFVSERQRRSVIPVAFWYISIFGSLLTLAYAVYIQEPVFIISQLGGMLVYARNLYFIKREQSAQKAA